MKQQTVSIIIPIFNEVEMVETAIRRIAGSHLPADTVKELIAVDDGSDDGTSHILDRLAIELPLRVLRHATNRGKGAALRTGLASASGGIVLFQDSDLEYDPRDFGALLTPILIGSADIVYGSRFLEAHSNPEVSSLSRWANWLLTWCSNQITGLRITDMETGYKVFKRSVFNGIEITENGFGVEPEITAKIAPGIKQGRFRLAEVPVVYHPRSRKQGKKIRFRDGLWALVCILRYSRVSVAGEPTLAP